MAKLSFLWHLHQPSYRTADGVSHAPWAAIHAGGAYRTLAAAIADEAGSGQVINIVPTLLEQLTAYRDGRVQDPIIESLTAPAGDLTDVQREILVSWAFHVTPRQLQRYPRLAELARRRELANGNRLAAAFGPGDLRDLQVLFILAQAGEQAWRDPTLAGISDRKRGFTPAQHEIAATWLGDQPARLIELWRELAELPGVELSTSPYAHPIMPLLIDTAIVAESWAPDPAPDVPPFRHPDDAAWQLERGLELMRNAGLDVAGCWPPEGSVSVEALSIYADAGVRWLVTDEGILERSLGRALRDRGAAGPELYRPWTLSSPAPVLFFRDRELSDAIGFRYGRWDDEARAARSLVADLSALGRSLPDEATVVLALDGENPWLHYPDGGGRFLRTLMRELEASGDELRPETLTAMTGSTEPSLLPALHPGSWINGVFATWIGHPEKTAAWRLLAKVREAIERKGGDPPPSLLVAEASDWFWWLGDDNPTELAPLYDRIFRRHLTDACRQAGVEAPADLQRPLKTVSRTVPVPVSSRWQAPTLDGRVTSYFEWCIATRVEIGKGAVERLALWADPGRLHLLVEGAVAMRELVAGESFGFSLESDGEAPFVATVGADGCDRAEIGCAVGQVIELSMSWNWRHPARLDIRAGDHSLLGDAVLLLEPLIVDETMRPPNEV
jgi:alpha-amylase/alpha-mannosidase (GH57 family)